MLLQDHFVRDPGGQALAGGTDQASPAAFVMVGGKMFGGVPYQLKQFCGTAHQELMIVPLRQVLEHKRRDFDGSEAPFIVKACSLQRVTRSP
jgi:hypothetical protein